MWRIRKKFFGGVIAIILMLSMMPISSAQAKAPNTTKDDLQKTQVVNLIAGQDKKVGTVTIEKKENGYLKATYELNEASIKDGWLIYEVHLAVEGSLSDIPQSRENKWGTNPVPGRFPYSRDFKRGVQRHVLDGIKISRYSKSENLYIAAHAVVKKKNSTIIKAPYGGTKVYDYNQGLDYYGNKVIALRSNPENGLHYETGMNEQNFYSLGFSNVDMKTGWIIIEFDNPIINGKGDDIEVIEDTWLHPYNVEQAEVSVSNDGKRWTKLGVAGNDNPISDYHTSTKFDLSSVCMKSAKYVKLQDISDFSPTDEGNSTDGFDLNAVLALHDYDNKCNKYSEETAWAEGTRFNEKGSWAMYFTIQNNVKEPSRCMNVFEFICYIFRSSGPKYRC